MKILFNVLVGLALFFLIARVNELHEKVDRAGVALTNAAQELDEATQFVYHQFNLKKAEDKKIDDAVKDVTPPVVASEPEPEPVAPVFNAVSPPPKKHHRGPVFK